jgi:hypothetical protein
VTDSSGTAHDGQHAAPQSMHPSSYAAALESFAHPHFVDGREKARESEPAVLEKLRAVAGTEDLT